MAGVSLRVARVLLVFLFAFINAAAADECSVYGANEQSCNSQPKCEWNDKTYSCSLKGSSSSTSCEAQYEEKVTLYNGLTWFSIGSSFIFFAVFYRIARGGNQTPQKLIKFGQAATVIGCIKLLIGLMLWTVLVPQCPQDCTCTGVVHQYYSYICFFIGLSWITRGSALLRRGKREAARQALRDRQQQQQQQQPQTFLAVSVQSTLPATTAYNTQPTTAATAMYGTQPSVATAYATQSATAYANQPTTTAAYVSQGYAPQSYVPPQQQQNLAPPVMPQAAAVPQYQYNNDSVPVATPYHGK